MVLTFFYETQFYKSEIKLELPQPGFSLVSSPPEGRKSLFSQECALAFWPVFLDIVIVLISVVITSNNIPYNPEIRKIKQCLLVSTQFKLKCIILDLFKRRFLVFVSICATESMYQRNKRKATPIMQQYSFETDC